MRVLIVEEDLRLSQALTELFQKHLYGVDAVYSSEECLRYARTDSYDVVILALSHSFDEIISVVETLRSEKNNVPIMVLSSLTDVENIVKALNSGADGYVTKPFSTMELVARIDALTRRKGELKTETIQFGDLILNLSNCELQNMHNQGIKLSLKELSIAVLLFEAPHQIIKKEKIIEKIWGGNSDAEYNNVEVYISFLRKKIDQLGVGVRIRTSRGIGYSLEEAEKKIVTA